MTNDCICITNTLEDACLLSQTVTAESVVVASQLAVTHGIKAVGTFLADTGLASDVVADSKVEVYSVVSFPYGGDNIESKVAAVANAIREGADAVDFVINIGALIGGNYSYLEDEFFHIGQLPITTKAIVELSLLSPGSLRTVCEILENSPVDYIKTCTGKLPSQLKVSLEDKLKKVSLMRTWAPSKKIKVSSGIKTLAQARLCLENGADVIGTSSTFDIAKEEAEENERDSGN
jgi:deoxyribose-phosphate aldolase